jgi:hypothetical protein
VEHRDFSGVEPYLGLATKELRHFTECEILRGGRSWRESKGFVLNTDYEKHFWRWCSEEEYENLVRRLQSHCAALCCNVLHYTALCTTLHSALQFNS